MACSCQKGQTNASARADRAAAAQTNAERRAAARAATSGRAIPDGKPQTAQGGTQSFALQTADGRVQHFGSDLEARAERARRGGTLVS